MTGNNRLVLNPATMMLAIQYYLENVLFNKDIKIKVIAVESTNEGFIIRLAEPTKRLELDQMIANGTAVEKA